MENYVVVHEMDNGRMKCEGIVYTYTTALGMVMDFIFKMKESFKDENDVFEYTDPEELSDENDGYFITVTYKSSNWQIEKVDTYFILLDNGLYKSIAHS